MVMTELIEPGLKPVCNVLSDESRFAIDSDTLFAWFLVNSWTTTFSSSSDLLPHGSCPLKHNNVNQTITEPEVVITFLPTSDKARSTTTVT